MTFNTQDSTATYPTRTTSSFARRSRLLTTVSAIAILASGFAGSAAVLGITPAIAGAPPIISDRVASQMSVADLVEKVKPAVVVVRVNIQSTADTGEDEAAPTMPDLPKGSPMERFFKQFGDQQGRPGMPRRVQPQGQAQAQGSGFFISPDGYIVTNNHVVDHAIKVAITLDDGRVLDAKVIGTDAKTDLALLKVDGGTFPYVTLAKTAPRVGDSVVAIGNPFGLGGSVTSGIISARGRDIGAGPYDDFLQIDAAVNHGNSGGPAFNLQGEVVGVNTAIYSPSGGSVGIGFAIPSETVQQVVAQLKQNGQVERGYLGVRTQSVTPQLADGLGLAQTKGAIVDSAEQGTPAAKAGLTSGDVITAVNGAPIADARDLARKIGVLKPGANVDITYMRGGKELKAKLELAALPSGKTAMASPIEPGQNAIASLGLSLAPAADVQGAGDHGVAVLDIDPNGAAARTGIKSGDVITEVAGKVVSTPTDVKNGLEATKSQGRKAVVMKVKSAEGTRFVAVELPKA